MEGWRFVELIGLDEDSEARRRREPLHSPVPVAKTRRGN